MTKYPLRIKKRLADNLTPCLWLKSGTISGLNSKTLRWKIMIFQVRHVLFCTTFLTPILFALIFEISNIISTSNFISPDRLIDPSCSFDDVPALKKSLCNSDVKEEGQIAGPEVCSASRYLFQPPQVNSCWSSSNYKRRLTVAIFLRSGVCPEQFTVRVIEDGLNQDKKVIWLEPFVVLKLLHCKRLYSNLPDQMEFYYSNFFVFEHLLRSFSPFSTDILECTARLRLPFQVQMHISQSYNPARTDMYARPFYVELRKHEE